MIHRFAQQRTLRVYLGCLISFLVVSVLPESTLFQSAEAQSGEFAIDGVLIEGTNRVDPGAVRLQLKSAFGRVTEELIGEDVRAIYRTGFFDQVSASVVQTEDHRRMLKYTVVEKPVVRKIYIRGNAEIAEKDLSDIIKFEGRKFLDKAKVDAMKRNAVSYYQSQGFYDASFEHSVTPVGDNEVDLTFSVTEGVRYRIREVNFRGLKEVDDSDLVSIMQTRTYKWWSSWLLGTGRLNKAMLDSDKTTMIQYMLDEGYVDASISDAVVESRDGGIFITFDVQEGRQYSIGRVSASGDLISKSVEETIDGIKSEPESTFGASKIREDAFLISDKFTDKGYAFANVIPNTSINRAAGTVDLDFQVDKGNLITVNRVNIRGNAKTYDNVIRREVRLSEQELFSSSKIKRSQEVLQRLGYFEEVNISTEPSQEADKVDLNVNVREGSTGSFSVGAGFSSSDGAIFNTRFAENNILGTGRSASINLDVGTERNNLIVSLNDRRVNDTRLSAGIDLYKTQREFSDFDRDLLGGSVGVGYPLEEIGGETLEDVTANMKLEYLDIDISDVDEEDAAPLVIQSEGRSTSASIIPSLNRNTINNPLNPTKGSQQNVSVESAGLAGEEDFYLIEASNTLYQPLLSGEWGDLTFSWRTRFGYGESRTDDPFPLFKRYFPGGINSVRGYKSRSLGPKDQDGDEYGGSKQLINNFELIFPLINSAGLKGVVFYDAGQAFDDDEDIDLGLLREAYGYGIRWTSPLGPIRVEFGYPIDKQEGEDSFVTLFSFGAPL